MKIIKSDKTGRNIHSPFVYRLVTNVLFAPYPFYAFSKINLLTENKPEIECLQFIFRLVNHFQFDNVLIIGVSDNNSETVCKLAKSTIRINRCETGSVEKLPADSKKYSRLVIINDIKSISSVGFPENTEVWIFNTLKKETALQFITMKSKLEVQVTIELNQLGIAIFNRNFEKQNYVIKH